MTAGCNLFKVLSLIVLISAFILKAFFKKSFLQWSTLQTTDQTARFLLCPNDFSPPAIHNPKYLLISQPQTKRYHKLRCLDGTATPFVEAERCLAPTNWPEIRASTWQRPHIPHCSSKLTATWSSSSGTQKPTMGTLCMGRERHFTAGSKPSPTLLRADQN